VKRLILFILFIYPFSLFSQTDTGITLTKRNRSNYNSSGHTLDDDINIKDCLDDEIWEIEYSFSSTLTGDLRFYIGENCNESQYRSDPVLCREIAELTDTSPEYHSTFEISVSQITGSSDCDSSYSGTYTLWVILFTSGGSSDSDILASGSIAFTVDFTPPESPQSLSVQEGEGKITVKWEYQGDVTEIIKYYILCAEADCEQGSVPFSEGESYFDYEEYLCKEVSGSTTNSAVISGLEIGVEYAFSVVAVDDAYNPSPISEVVCGTPVEVEDFWEYYKSVGGEEKGEYCFIATEVYGSYDAENVKVLRKFRDEILRFLPGGELFIDYYYSHGRVWAEYIHRNEYLKKGVKASLDLFVLFLRVPLFIWENLLYILLFSSIIVLFLKLRGRG